MKQNIISSIFIIILIMFSSIGMFTISSISEERYEQSGIESSDLEKPTSNLANSPWPMFNQNNNHTSVSPYSTRGVDGTVEWRFGTDGFVYSSPAIGENGTIYVGSEDTYLYAINPNGTEKWNFSTGGHIYSSPAVESDGTIYIGSKDHHLYAIRPDGTHKWNYSVGDEIDYSSPAIGEDGTIYIGSMNTTQDNLFAIYPNGTKRWSYQTEGAVWSSPAIGQEGTVYIGSGEKLYAINPDGSQKWSYQTGGTVWSSPAIGQNGRIYLGSTDGNIYALDQAGDRIWNYKFSGELSGSIFSSPAITDDGTIYVGVDQGSTGGYLVALSQEDGTRSVKWSVHREGLDLLPSPAVSDDGTIYMGGVGCGCVDTDYEFFAVSPDGELKWEERTTESSSPAIGEDGTVYVGGYTDLWAFGSEMEILMESKLNTTSCLPDSALKVNGTAYLINGVVADGANVTVEVNGTKRYTTVSSDSTFEKGFNAPSSPGTYTVNININSTEYGVENSTTHNLQVTSTPKPDIVLTSMDLNYSDQALYEEDQIEVGFVVENLGSAFAEFNISMSLDGLENVSDTKKMNLSSGGKKKGEFFTTAISGDHKLWLKAGGVDDEDDLNNNLINATYTAIEKIPDIEMSAIDVDRPETVWEESVIDLETDIWNNGTIDIDVDAVFSIDSETNHSKWFNLNMGVDEKKSIGVDWTATRGEHTLWIIADPNGTIDDEYITNSKQSVTISVLKKTSEISISGMKTSPDQNLTIGDEITASAVVENKGTASADFDVVLSIDDKDNVTERTELTLGAGESEDVDFPYTLSSSSQVLWLIADYNDSVEENLESDNTIYKIVEASQPGSTEDQEDEEQTDTQNEDEEGTLDTKDDPGFPYWILVIISAVVLSVILFIYWKEEDEDEEEGEDITSSEE